VTMKNGDFCDVTPCGCCKIRRFGGTYRLHHQVDYTIIIVLCSKFRVLVTADVVPSSPILVTMMIEAECSSETSVFTRAT
jgi:hypothetical protein